MMIEGIRLATAQAGLYARKRLDMALIELCPGSASAALFTQNRCAGAPVHLARRHLSGSQPRYLLFNAGNANAGTGERGMRDAQTLCAELALLAGCAVNEILPFSTGVIGEYLPLGKMRTALPKLLENLGKDNWLHVAEAIMTTDTKPKLSSGRCMVAGREVGIVGIAKGSGMIHPNMATMLAFVGTDLGMSSEFAQRLFKRAVDKSFNRISVDGDTSTNDACVLSCSGLSGVLLDERDEEGIASFSGLLDQVCLDLAQLIVRDGEGAGKFVEIEIAGAIDTEMASQAAYTLAHSPLVKTALAASDPNWGRMLSAIGAADMRIEQERLSIHIGDAQVVSGGSRHSGYTEQAGQLAMSSEDIRIRVDLGLGNASERIWTCDLTAEYVRINSDYRS
ncbi:MAG: bifunctional glutamate N-acetyltransferase/amino-acid acetyltransferase ArgJ [Candidatus Eutrophobiaceae bacterium]